MIFILLLGLLLNSGFSSRPETLCRDSEGNIVDWWILYKKSGSLEYIYLSSVDAEQKQRYSQPLRADRLINDIHSSPFLQTVYKSRPSVQKVIDVKDNRMILAWNDQQPHGNHQRGSAQAKKMEKSKRDKKMEKSKRDKKMKSKRDKKMEKSKRDKKMEKSKRDKKMEKSKRDKKMEKMDPYLEETKLGNGKDMYGKTESKKYAHSKGILGLSVQTFSNRKSEGLVKMYLISHSFPRTPNGAITDGPIQRTHIPEDPLQFFGSNITIPTSKAQHAMCISMEQRVKLENGEIVFDRSKVDLQTMNLFAILNGLDVIGPSLTLTNYVPWQPHFKIYHQLFDIRNTWDKKPIDKKDRIKNSLNVARTILHDKKKNEDAGGLPTHAFPIWPSITSILLEGNEIKNYKHRGLYCSLRDQSQINVTQCRVWKTKVEERRDVGCFASAILRSTGKKPLVVHFLAKNRIVKADVDDIIASRLLPKHDLDLAENDQNSPKKQVAILVTYQSWYDHATYGKHPVDITSTPRLRTRVYFYNNVGIYMPKQEGSSITKVAQPSMGHDHSKWFVSYLFGKVGNYKPIVGITDLNRNRKATQLSNEMYGRGGFFFISSNPGLVRFFLSLEPIIEDSSNFTNVPINYFTTGYNDEDPLYIANVNKLSKEGDVMQVELDVEHGSEKYALPYCQVPSYVLRMVKQPNECPATEEATTAKLLKTPKTKESEYLWEKFYTGSPGFRAQVLSSPRMRAEVAARNRSRELGEIPQDKDPESGELTPIYSRKYTIPKIIAD